MSKFTTGTPSHTASVAALLENVTHAQAFSKSLYNETPPFSKKKNSNDGAGHDTSRQMRESLFSVDWWKDILTEAKCGVGQNPEDTGCTPASKSKTKSKKPNFDFLKNFKVKLPSYDSETLTKSMEKSNRKHGR